MSRLYVVSGPSGVSKSTVVARLLQQRPDIWLSVSATTRSPRPGERHGREYFFVSPEEFVAQGQAGICSSGQVSPETPGTRVDRCRSTSPPGSPSCWRSSSKAPGRSVPPCQRPCWSSSPRPVGKAQTPAGRQRH